LDTPVLKIAAGASHEPPGRIKAVAILEALPKQGTGGGVEKSWQL